jgi:hypothetical protein
MTIHDYPMAGSARAYGTETMMMAIPRGQTTPMTPMTPHGPMPASERRFVGGAPMTVADATRLAPSTQTRAHERYLKHHCSAQSATAAAATGWPTPLEQAPAEYTRCEDTARSLVTDLRRCSDMLTAGSHAHRTIMVEHGTCVRALNDEKQNHAETQRRADRCDSTNHEAVTLGRCGISLSHCNAKRTAHESELKGCTSHVATMGRTVKALREENANVAQYRKEAERLSKENVVLQKQNLLLEHQMDTNLRKIGADLTKCRANTTDVRQIAQAAIDKASHETGSLKTKLQEFMAAAQKAEAAKAAPQPQQPKQ